MRIETAVRAERSRSGHRTVLGKPNVRWIVEATTTEITQVRLPTGAPGKN